MINRISKRHRYRSMFYQRRTSIKLIDCTTRISMTRFTPRIAIPEQIGISKEESRRLLLDAVKKIHNSVKNNKCVYIDFSKTVKVYTEGMLYLYAELENNKNIYKNIIIKCIKSRVSKVNHVLNQIGIFEICSYTFSPCTEYNDVIHWKKTSGVDVTGAKFDEIIDPDSELMELPLALNVYGGFIEAIKNAREHAYIKKRELSDVASLKTAWWVFSQIKDQYIHVSICDLGIGIPETVHIQWKEIIKSLLKEIRTPNDADIIKAAIETPSSRTGERNRGNGLKTISGIAKDDERASFSIYSGRGLVFLRRKKIVKLNFATSLPGTIVCWKLPLSAPHQSPTEMALQKILHEG